MAKTALGLLNNSMGRFKLWLAESLQMQKDRELQDIWKDTFEALGIGGLEDEDAAQQSLSNIKYGQRNPDRKQTSVFKGKQAVRKRLENAQIFSRLEKSNDPEIRKGVEDARRWLDTSEPEHSANASTTVSTLLQKMFGKYFQQFIDSDAPMPDRAKAQVPPQPPKQSPGPEQPAPDAGQPPMPDPNMMAQQPQVPGGPMPPAPTAPMPPKPAGAEMGMF